MNDATESADAPRRSGRERKQVISVYTEAKRAAVAERKKAKNSGNFERSTRYGNYLMINKNHFSTLTML